MRATVSISKPKRRCLLVAAMGAGAGDDGAGDDATARAGARASTSRRVAGLDGVDGGGGAVGLAGAVVEDGGVGDEHERQQEVAHHERRGQVEGDGEGAQHDLAEHPGDEAQRQQGEVAPAGLPPERAEDGEDDRDRDEAGDQPVDELDHRVQLEGGHELLLLAAGPVRAARGPSR